jgi:hypothetical protein
MRRKSLKSLSLMFLVLSLFFTYQVTNSESGFAQTNKDVSITIIDSSFHPLTTVHGNQVRVSITYQVNDESLENEKINGIMKIYSSNGTLIHSSSFPEGFVAKKKGGTEDFKTTIRDPAIKDLLANVTFIDLDKKDTLSNTVTANLSFQESGTSATAGSTEEGSNSNDEDEE